MHQFTGDFPLKSSIQWDFPWFSIAMFDYQRVNWPKKQPQARIYRASARWATCWEIAEPLDVGTVSSQPLATPGSSSRSRSGALWLWRRGHICCCCFCRASAVVKMIDDVFLKPVWHKALHALLCSHGLVLMVSSLGYFQNCGYINPKSSILLGFRMVHNPFWGSPVERPWILTYICNPFAFCPSVVYIHFFYFY